MLEWQWGEGTVQGCFFMGFKSAWQFLETGTGWDYDYSSSIATMLILPAPLSSSRLMSPNLAFVTDHPAPIRPDYWLSSIMD